MGSVIVAGSDERHVNKQVSQPNKVQTPFTGDSNRIFIVADSHRGQIEGL